MEGFSWYADAYRWMQIDGMLEGQTLQGIAAQLEHRGERSLSPRQVEVVADVVDRFLSNAFCPCCGNQIAVDEALVWMEHGYCGTCNNRRYKDN